MSSAQHVLQRLNPIDQKVVKDVAALLEETSRQTQEFARTTDLHCKAGCGKCCENPNVETTVSELMPLAVELWAAAGAEAVLTAVAQAGSKGTCVFYKPDPAMAGNGRCSVYAQRPGICRLFGFSAKTDKHGKARLITCKVIKEQSGTQYAQAQESLDAGATAPMISAFTMKVYDIDPLRGMELFPINKAVRLALQRVGMALDI